MSGAGKITGRVAQVLNSLELVINRGSKDGVEKGMRFAVLAASPIIVTDPETNEEIGTVDRVKIRVQASEVQDRITICTTYRMREVGGSGVSLSELFGGLAGIGPSQRVRETFKASESSLPAPISNEESIVASGDRVVQIDDSLEPESSR